MNMFTLAGSAARKDGTIVTYSQRREAKVKPNCTKSFLRN